MAQKRTAARLHMLTVREVQAARDGDYSDGGGLTLRIRGDSASWVLRFTAPSGRRREMGLGVALRGNPKLAGDSLTGARDAAHKARELLRQEIDPIEARESRKAAERLAAEARKAEKQRERRTLARCARDYHERVIEPTRTIKHAAQWIASLENHVPAALWNAPIDSITPPQLLKALEDMTPHERARNFTGTKVPETLRRVRQRLDSIFEDAIFHGYAASNPASAVRRKVRETMPKREGKTKGFRALPYKEAPALMQRLRDAQGTAARCLELAMLTAARTSEALLAQWSEFDLDGGTWTVPAGRMKAKEEHVVFLSDRALEILRDQVGQDARYVFPSSMPTEDGQQRPMSNMAMLTVLDRLSVRDRTTVHGLCRATFSTWANETAAARPDVIEACLAHSEADKVRRAYNRSEFMVERRALLQAWADYLAQPAAKVIPIGQAA